MADAFQHASGMAQSHAGGSISGRDEAARYVKAPTKPDWETLYPRRARRRVHREEKMHVSGGVSKVSYELVEDWTSRSLVVAPFHVSKDTGMAPIFLDLERLLSLVDGLDCKPWVKHADAAARDAAVAKFVMGRLQLARDGHAIFVPRADHPDDDGKLEIPRPPTFDVTLGGFDHPFCGSQNAEPPALSGQVQVEGSPAPAPAGNGAKNNPTAPVTDDDDDDGKKTKNTTRAPAKKTTSSGGTASSSSSSSSSLKKKGPPRSSSSATARGAVPSAAAAAAAGGRSPLRKVAPSA
eukprot:CAMPEP_0118920028 /NCGR_PEP_ID=MMETSP1166-20130328/18863_1 /TAXON_ID=1104430 /ORGANISM="Chrysoreinhardia sp, Strain CCMP3193" /LENGTH=293 /DNA_ID=CAMNT_0006860565 /DNA_START=1237 /DNA_END=2118 /DNA_ORIENTATION=+